MKEIEKLLERAGLSPGEAKVYVALAELGISTVGPIVNKSGVSTSKVYAILNRLIVKGLASSVIENTTKKFKAEDPARIFEYIEEKEKELETTKKELNDKIKSLVEKIKLSDNNSTTTVFEGFKGMKSVFDRSLNELKKGDTMYVSGITESTDEIRTYFLHYFKKQARIGFEVKALFDESATYKAKERKNKLTEFRFLPSGIITPAAFVIYKNKTIIFVGNKMYILTILINNHEIANSFKNYFNLLWKQAKK